MKAVAARLYCAIVVGFTAFSSRKPVPAICGRFRAASRRTFAIKSFAASARRPATTGSPRCSVAGAVAFFLHFSLTTSAPAISPSLWLSRGSVGGVQFAGHPADCNTDISDKEQRG